MEVSDGEVMLDAHLPPADVIDHCETTLKVGPANAKIRARFILSIMTEFDDFEINLKKQENFNVAHNWCGTRDDW